MLLVVSTAPAGIVTITHGLPDVSLALETTDNRPAYYGIGLPLQVSGTQAAIFCNLRAIGPGFSDYEDGTDVLIFDSLNSLRTARPVALSRNQKWTHTETAQEHLIVKFPMAGGFWPLGAKSADGSRHPGEGRGFGICQALSFLVDSKGFFTWTKPFVRHLEVVQLHHDEARLQVSERKLMGPNPLPVAGPNGWQLVSPGLTNAISVVNDLLQPVLARRNGQYRSGVCRWKWQDGRWVPVSFVPIGAGSEPTLVRVADRSLMFTTRPEADQVGTIVIWRSTDAGRTWQETVRQHDISTSAPLSIIRTVCGMPFITTNPLGSKRTKLSYWQINGTGLSGQRLIRDCTAEFGPRPKGTFWAVDHPSSATVRLADGRWHSILTYRIKTFRLPTLGREEPVVPQTGCYVEEILSTGPAVPEWHF